MTGPLSLLAVLYLALGDSGAAIATEVIRAGDRVSTSNIAMPEGTPVPNDYPLVGLETTRTVYQGQTVTAANTQSARLVRRNGPATLKYVAGGLEILLEGRSMSDGALNDEVSVLNLKSRKIVIGIVTANGEVSVR